jgi:transcriptional regulator with GAF, ATPase, and Fis domain
MTTHVTIPQIRCRHRAEEKRLILGALERNGRNVDRTARDLGVRPSGLRAMIKVHGIELKHRLPAGRPRKT